jgi:hypothetical protein
LDLLIAVDIMFAPADHRQVLDHAQQVNYGAML